MKITAIFLTMSCFLIPLSTAADEVDMDAVVVAANVPQSWRDAAASWGMNIEDYKREAERVLKGHAGGDLYSKKTGSDLVPLFNPYAKLDPRVEEELRKLFPAVGAYEEFIRTQTQNSPKFTIAR